MRLRTLCNHTVDLDRLPVNAIILDVGCRGFDFTTAIRHECPEATIFALDPDAGHPTIPDKGSILVERMALVGDGRTTAPYASWSTGEGNCLLAEFAELHYATIRRVPCINISRLMRITNIQKFDLVKLDCEGSEFQILELWPGPVARQISVEFHDSGYTPGYGQNYDYLPMFRHLVGMGYQVVKHELSKQGDGVGHWDSLIVLGDAK